MILSVKEVEHFKQQGYLIQEGVYTGSDLTLLRQGLTITVQNKCNQLMAQGLLDQDFAQEPFETRLAQLYKHNQEAGRQILGSIWSGSFHGPGILKALRHSSLIDRVSDLIGPDIVATSIYRIRPKVPGHLQSEVPWHQDAGYSMAHCYDYEMITCWIPLVDVNQENGCLWLIPAQHQSGIIQHYAEGHAGYLEIAPEEVPAGAIPIEISAGSVLIMTGMTPHASFENRSDIVRWSIDLRYQDFNVPNNIDEKPEDYIVDRDPVTMACHPGEAYFVIRDTKNPGREMKDPIEFAKLRQRWNQSRIRGVASRWISLSERERGENNLE